MKGKEGAGRRWMKEGGYFSYLWRQTDWGKDLWLTARPELQGQVEVEVGGGGGRKELYAWERLYVGAGGR